MRGAFIRTLAELAERDSRIVLLTGDLGFMALEPFSRRFPTRFVNAGVAEQNMVGTATGLAEAGFIPFVYSIVPFVSLRPFEFIRNGPIAHRFPIRIVGVGTGFEYSHNGISHYGLEDAGVMRIQPGITVVSPADFEQTRTALLATWDLSGPIYYRIGKDDRTTIPGLFGAFTLGKPLIVAQGGDLIVLAMGSVTVEASAAIDAFQKLGIEATLAVVADLHSTMAGNVAELLSGYSMAVTVEAHYVNGGLGSLVAEVIAEYGLTCRLVRCGVKTQPTGWTGSQDFLYRLYGITREAIVDAAANALNGNRPQSSNPGVDSSKDMFLSNPPT